jgi:hypothetical protein
MLETIINPIVEGKNPWIISLIILIAGIINAKAIYEFLDPWSKRKWTIIKDFLGDKGATGKTKEILQEELNSEIFKYTKGINAEKHLREEIIYLNELSKGRLKYLDFKRANLFLTIEEDGKLGIRKFTRLDRVIWMLNILLSVGFFLFFVLTLSLVTFLVSSKSDLRNQFFILLVIFLYAPFFFGCSILTFSQVLSFNTAKKIKKEISKLPYKNPSEYRDWQSSKNFKITLLEADKQAARQRFENHFGEIDLGYPTGTDNERIDADLAKEYANNNQED